MFRTFAPEASNFHQNKKNLLQILKIILESPGLTKAASKAGFNQVGLNHTQL
jgi:hypothetical protein